jgi:tetratricopeptide (TPR) repeat protein
MQKLFIISLLLITSHLGFSQNPLKLDSLLTEYNFAETDTQKINTLLELSNLYSTKNYAKSLEYADEALDISNQIDNKQFIAKSHLRAGYLFVNSGDYDEALKNCLVSLEIYESYPIGSELFNTYIITGVIYDRIFNYDEALNYYFKALNISNELKQKNDPTHKSLKDHILYNNIGNIYETKNENETAIEYYKKGLELAKIKNDYHHLGVIYNNLGKIHNKLIKYDEAYEFLKKSLEAREKINDKAGMAKSYYFICAHFFEQNKYDKALEYATKSLELGKEVGSLQTQHSSVWFLYQIFYEMGQFKKAADYHIEYKNINDSLLNSQTINEITRLKMQYDFDAQEAERKIEVQKTKFKYILTLGTLILGLIILILFLIIIKSRNNRIKLLHDNLEKDIELKNKELTTNVIYLIQKNEMISEISSKLLKLKSKMKEENKEPIQRIIFELGSVTDESIWQEFELRFQSVHQDFYSNLVSKFPDLSKGDMKLCAFLKLGMSSKEIASVTNQALKSVEVARTRLRKKLDLTNTEIDLIDFFNEI